MSTIRLDPTTVTVELTTWEHVFTLRGDVTVPRGDIASAEVATDALAAARGLRAPGLGAPGIRKVGTWRTRGSRTLVSVRRNQPAVHVRLRPSSDWDALLVGADDAAAIVALLTEDGPAAGADEEVRFPVPGAGELSGSLRMPAEPGDRTLPAALLIAGSGPVDRDGNAKRAPIGIQLALADVLARTGVASLRFDRRGISDGTDWRESTFGDNTRDAAAALDALAACFSEGGAAAGEGMRLVGHADPRGTEEYNMALGQRRAGSVAGYLSGKGLGDDKLETSSRGEMDATGTDEATWAEDRKVMIFLAE